MEQVLVRNSVPSFCCQAVCLPAFKYLSSAAPIETFGGRLGRERPPVSLLNNIRKTWKPSGELKIQRRTFVRETMAAGLLVCTAALAETAVEEPTSKGLEKLPFKPEGYNYWTWQGHKVHYVVHGQGSPIVLIHGFGASAYHWRYNIPELAKTHAVYAIDLLGFGWSEKALRDYSAFVWRDQVADFVKEVVGQSAVLAGNSVGGFTALMTAAGYPDLVSGLVLLNASGQFDSSASPEQQQKMLEETAQEQVIEESALQRLIVTPAKTLVRKYAIFFAFWQAKQPARIKSVLQNVYKDQTNVDEYLVQSIVQPTKDPNAAEVYYRLMTQILFQPSNLTLNKLLSQLSCPLLLLWGDLDPWMGPTKADQIKKLYPQATMASLEILCKILSDIVKHLSLPPAKLHCSMLAEDAIKAAVKDYQAKKAKREEGSKPHDGIAAAAA